MHHSFRGAVAAAVAASVLFAAAGVSAQGAAQGEGGGLSAVQNPALSVPAVSPAPAPSLPGAGLPGASSSSNPSSPAAPSLSLPSAGASTGASPQNQPAFPAADVAAPAAEAAGTPASAASGAPAVSAAGSSSPATPAAEPSVGGPGGSGGDAEPAVDRVLPHDLTPMGMFMAASAVVKAVMIGLALASVATWTVLLAKWWELRTARRRLRQAFAAVEKAQSLSQAAEDAGFIPGPAGEMLRAALTETRQSVGLPGDGLKERVASRLERIEAAAARRISAGMGVLASIGSTGPFVGLFGTVWGIMVSFIGISKSQTTNLAVVAPGIAEALLATAVGLVAAIPAVVIYNVFSRSIGGYRGLAGDLSAAVQRHVSRDYDRAAAAAGFDPLASSHGSPRGDRIASNDHRAAAE